MDIYSTRKRFDLILADPPWEFSNKGHSRVVTNHYPDMKLADICALPVARLAERDAVLFLWATTAHLMDGSAHKVIAAWQFEARTGAVWVKTGCFGMGKYFRQEHEHLILAVRGKPGTSADHSLRSVIYAPRGEHSAKPVEVYRVIERMYPHAKRIELFARARRRGWSAWGNELA